MTDLRAWMGYQSDAAEEGAALVFARNHREARLMAFPPLTEWGTIWIDVRARLLKHQDQFMPHCTGEPSGTVDIPFGLTCENCQQWGELMIECTGGPLCPPCNVRRMDWLKGDG